MDENMNNAMHATFEDVVEKVKGGDTFSIYRNAVLDDKENSKLLLEMDVMLRGLIDKEFSLMVHKVATDTLCEKLDERLKSEILAEDSGISEAMDFAESLLKKRPEDAAEE